MLADWGADGDQAQQVRRADPRTDAPGALLAVQRFVNTADLELTLDHLATAETATRVVRYPRARRPVGTLSERDVHVLRAFRERVRGYLEGDERLPPALPGVPVTLTVSRDTLQLSATGPGVQAVLGRLYIALAVAVGDDSLSRLRVCKDRRCRWVFYDSTRNGRGSGATTPSAACATKCGREVSQPEPARASSWLSGWRRLPSGQSAFESPLGSSQRAAWTFYRRAPVAGRLRSGGVRC